MLTMPSALFAQSINRADLLDKIWYIVAMKCTDNPNVAEDQYIQYYGTIKLWASNANLINYGKYEKVYRDKRDNPIEFGTYSLTTDETNSLILTLKKHRTGESVQYKVAMVEANHLTLIRLDEGDKCKITYAISL
jgi:hypothetical protein